MLTPVGHQRRVLLLSQVPTDARQFRTAVDSLNLGGVVHRYGLHSPAARAVNRDEIGKVILPLGVRCPDAAHLVEQTGELEGVDTGIDLVNGAFGRAGVLLLDNTCNLLAVSDDASVSVRI